MILRTSYSGSGKSLWGLPPVDARIACRSRVWHY
ncbi:hypothetical protein PSTT_10011 [Puccinia striiformis]|uniref:Uncharacterized protein n=1 Tax=Puccinia striiformis TaxID=27350 RepID=A0A2S4V668_9BASI|nr:hypothetical protein PSTT_10011 [Puccinia striiformis]